VFHTRLDFTRFFRSVVKDYLTTETERDFFWDSIGERIIVCRNGYGLLYSSNYRLTVLIGLLRPTKWSRPGSITSSPKTGRKKKCLSVFFFGELHFFRIWLTFCEQGLLKKIRARSGWSARGFQAGSWGVPEIFCSVEKISSREKRVVIDQKIQGTVPP